MASRDADDGTPAVLTIDELAARWRVDRKTLYEAVRKGDLRAIKLGRALRIPLSEVLSLEQGRVTPGGSNARTT